MKHKGLWTALAVLATAVTAAAAQAKDARFFLHDGDRVVFYGDSITEQQMYGRDIETYVETRFPKMHVKFINSGWSGDTVRGGGGGPIETRLKRDVLPYKPTVVTIFLGMNDGGYRSFDPQTFQAYATGLTHIVDELTRQFPGVRLTLLTPSFFDYNAKDRQPPDAGHGYDYAHPAPDYNQTLLRYGDFVKKFGAKRHLVVADLNPPMAAATEAGRRADPKFALSGDGVHPNEVGHLIMAATVLQAWNAPPALDVALTPGKAKTLTLPLPWPVPESARQAFAVSPQFAPLAQVFVTSSRRLAPESRDTVLVDGQEVGTFTGPQLAPGGGVNLAPYSALPENQQAQQVLALVDERIGRWHEFFKGKNGLAHANDGPADAELTALKAEDVSLDALRAQEQQAAQPKPHTFELRPVAP